MQQIVAYKLKMVMVPLRLLRLFLALLACNAWGQATPDSQDHFRAVETGLGPPVAVVGQPPDRRDLRAEMNRLHVPAVSIAIVHGGKIEWAKGYGIMREGGAPVTPPRRSPNRSPRWPLFTSNSLGPRSESKMYFHPVRRSRA